MSCRTAKVIQNSCLKTHTHTPHMANSSFKKQTHEKPKCQRSACAKQRRERKLTPQTVLSHHPPTPAQKQHFFPNFLFSLIPRLHTQFNTSACTAYSRSDHTPETNSPCGRDTPKGRGEESRNTCAQFLSGTLKSGVRFTSQPTD